MHRLWALVVFFAASSGCGDDGASRTPDGSSILAVCGNGLIEGDETCDDGNQSNDDDCPDGADGSCQPATCGDGFLHASASEVCDDGAQDICGPCNADCTVANVPCCPADNYDVTWDPDNGVYPFSAPTFDLPALPEDSHHVYGILKELTFSSKVDYDAWRADSESNFQDTIAEMGNVYVSHACRELAWVHATTRIFEVPNQQTQ